jgi:AraC-like DNA-binding protein
MPSMNGRASAPQEVVDYRRSAALPGLEVIHAQDSLREWRVICPRHAVVVFRTWRGGVHYRGRMHAGEPGVVFCNTPGEIMIANPQQGPGSFHVLELESDVLEHWLAEQQPGSVRLDWAGVMRPISEQLRARFVRFFAMFEATVSAMQAQSEALELSGAMIGELIAGAQAPRSNVGTSIRAVARMRECLNEEGLSVDLDTLAKRAGLSRFHALRAFKQRYGLPPHAYQLCLRIGHARRLLFDGAAAADVALRCGFADQSHFTRHFKRFHGVTPVQYAQGRARRTNNVPRVASHPESIVSGSDR